MYLRTLFSRFNPITGTMLVSSQAIIDQKSTVLFRLPLTVIMIALLWVSATPVQAQDTQAISFQEAIQLALQQNIMLKQAANTVEQQRTNVSDRRMAFLPNLSFGTSTGNSFGRYLDQTENKYFNEMNQSFSASTSSSVNVFTGFRTRASLNQAQIDMEATDLDFERTRQTVVFNVASSFLALIERQERIRIQEENLTSQEQQLSQIEEMVRVGSRPISDLYQQQASTAAAEASLLDAERLLQLGQVALIALLQLDPFGSYNFVAPVVEDSDLIEQQYDLDELIRTAFQARSDLHAQELSIDAATEGIRIARASRLPSIGFSLSYRSQWSSARKDFLTGQAVPFFDQLDANRGGSMGLSFSMPIFDRFSTRNSVQRAQLSYNNQQLALENMRHDIALQVRQAYLDYLTTLKQLDVTEKQEIAAQQALDAAQERYNVGAATLVELTQARAAYIQAASGRIQAKFDFVFQEKLIDYYIGRLNPNEPLLR